MKFFCNIIATAIVLVFFGVPGAATADTAAIQQAAASLNQYQALQKSAGIQNPNLSYGMRQALVLADLLFDSAGNLELSQTQAVQPYFIPQQPEQYEVNIVKVLNQLDTTWQSYFRHVVLPSDPQNVGNLVLRALFSLGAEDVLTDRHAKVAVLASLFAPYNQGPVGDCFAVSDLIRDHEEYYKHSVGDYAAIIQKGYLTRIVGSNPDNFFFLPILADGDSSNTFTLDQSGNIVGPNIPLLNAPGLAAAVNIMGGNQVQNFAQQLVANLFNGSNANEIQVTPTMVIETAGAVIASNQPNVNSSTLIANGLYAFSSLTNNPVLRATECAFAAMAEDRSDDSTRGNVNNCVSQALKNVWATLGNNTLSPSFQNTFFTEFDSSYRLIYNANIPLAQVAADGSSSDGGFQLYKRVPGDPTAIGTWVQTPQEFQQLVLNGITLTVNSLGGTAEANAFAAGLSNYVLGNDFLRDALWAYDPSNKQVADPVTNYQKLSRTPMQSCDGDNPYEVDAIDTGHPYDANVVVYTPANTNGLVTWCLNMAKTAPAGLYPMNSPQHAFNFDTTNPDLAAFAQGSLNSAQWINQKICVPGMKVSTSIIDPKTKAALSNAMLQMIFNQVPKGMSAYQALVNKLNKQNLTVQAYAQNLLNGIINILGVDSSVGNQIALALDAVLLQSLPANAGSILRHSVIRFAFTNWNDGTKDIYFCGFFNPRTQKVAFGIIDEDLTGLQPIDEISWVNYQQWDVDLHPYAPSEMVAGF